MKIFQRQQGKKKSKQNEIFSYNLPFSKVHRKPCKSKISSTDCKNSIKVKKYVDRKRQEMESTSCQGGLRKIKREEGNTRPNYFFFLSPHTELILNQFDPEPAVLP